MEMEVYDYKERGLILAKMETLGGSLLIFAFVLVIAALPTLYVFGAAWLGRHVIDYVALVAGFALFACVFTLLPLAIFRATRIVSVYGLFISSYVFGIGVWLAAFPDLYQYWGLLGVVIGLLLYGVGVIPLAILAQVLHLQWQEAAVLIAGVVLAYGARKASDWLAGRVAWGDRAGMSIIDAKL